MEEWKSLQHYLQKTMRFWVEDEHVNECFQCSSFVERQSFQRKKQQLHDRDAKIVKTLMKGRILNRRQLGSRQLFDYVCHVCHLIEQKDHFYMEEKRENRRAGFQNGKILSDEPIVLEGAAQSLSEQGENTAEWMREGFQYHRLEAVRYADRWWDSHNPDYRAFEVDCTNYVSQCLRAGGAPMSGQPNRSRGWWYSGNSWSFSWAVANALKQYLSYATHGLHAKEMASAEELMPGDVICYDFDGNGHWQHNTVVTAKDAQGMPLVNAHTVNSRNRYWAYRDSPAWTPKIQYRFYHIIDGES